jgi:hypothetical protein
MHHLLARAVIEADRWLAATPSPAPKTPNANLVTPGAIGFAITFGVAVVTVFLIIDMTRRVRRTAYRAEIAEKLDAEQAAGTAEGDGAPADAGSAPSADDAPGTTPRP